jgi:hypothetical protein
MSRQTAAAALVAFVLAGVTGFLANGSDDPPQVAVPTTPSTSPSTVPAPSFVEPGETVVGPAVVVTSGLRVDANQVVLDFDVAGLAPVGDAASVIRFLGFQSTEEIPPEDLDTVFLDQWVLETPAGDIPGRVANPSARAARFDVGPDFDLSSVTGIRIASYALLVPIDAAFDLDVASDTVAVAPGITARLLAVTEQVRTIVQVEVLSTRSFNYDNIRVSGRGPGWKSAVREAEGRPRWNLTFDADRAPSPIELRLSGSIWIGIDVDIPVNVDLEA